MPVHLGRRPNYFKLMPDDGFTYTQGAPASFTRPELECPVTREFCGTCGTHMVTRRIGRRVVVLKVGTLDDPAAYGSPNMAIHTADQQPFHVIAEGVPTAHRLPQR